MAKNIKFKLINWLDSLRMGYGLFDNNKTKCFLDNWTIRVGFVVVEMRGQKVALLGVVVEGIGMV